MFQSAGHDAIEALAECMELPLIRKVISGTAIEQNLNYEPKNNDEVENLYQLLKDIKVFIIIYFQFLLT